MTRGEEFRDDLLSWAESNLRQFSWRDPERSVYEVFVVEFFLTQTPAENVERVYPEFVSKYPTLARLRDADQSELESAIEPLGFQRMRAESLSEIAANRDAIPTTVDELLQLPRVGPYVANATLCFARERALPICDRNVRRVYSRVFGERFPDTAAEQRAFAAEMLPNEGSIARTYNLALLDFGAIVCRKREPRCSECFANEYCDYYQTQRTET
jgi:A/G-specific adenine glycosylase